MTLPVVLWLGTGWAQGQPVNNMFANRTAISGTNVTVYGSNINATKEAGEPNHADNPGGASVWWSWSASASGPVQVSLKGSSFDTILGVYLGAAVSGLSTVASNDDEDFDAGVYTSKVIFTAVAGQTYQIAVDGFAGDTGSITLKVQQPPPPALPASLAPAWQLPAPNGTIIRSTDYSGKVVMYNFWGTTCGPCLAEMPDMVALQDKYRSDGFVIIGADVSWWYDTPQGVLNFLASFTPTINYQIVMSTPANEAAFGGIGGVPTTFIIDRQNYIRKKYVGSQTGTEFETQIIPLLYRDTTLQGEMENGQMTLRWPAGVVPFTLESTASLNNPIWTPWPTQPIVVNGTNLVQVPTSGSGYFRLQMTY